MKNIWGRDKEINLSYGEKAGIWIMLAIAFALGAIAGAALH